MPPPVARFVLGPVLARFLEQYPEIVIETTVESSLTDIVAGRYDAGFRRGNLVARDMIARRVTNDMHYLVVASPDYLARHGRPHAPADLYAHSAADSSPGCLSLTARPSNSTSKDPLSLSTIPNW